MATTQLEKAEEMDASSVHWVDSRPVKGKRKGLYCVVVFLCVCACVSVSAHVCPSRSLSLLGFSVSPLFPGALPLANLHKQISSPYNRQPARGADSAVGTADREQQYAISIGLSELPTACGAKVCLRLVFHKK
jgi:hypothetical protein